MISNLPFFIMFVIALAFFFDFINGFHDAANSIATIVATGVLSPRWAVVWAAFFNFIAFLFFKLHVASTIGTGLFDPRLVDAYVIFAALGGAISWNLITWYYGLPSSSSHALIGGLVGAAVTKAGVSSLNFLGLSKVLISIVLSPLFGFCLGMALIALISRFVRDPASPQTQKRFGRLQFLSASLLSLGHGGNDAQKTMGIIAVLLFSSQQLGEQFYVPWWVIISCNFVMGLGTLMGGWRIVHTLGKKITQLTPMTGSCAEFAAASTLFIATHAGIPVSTTHTITGAITGVGAQRGFKQVHWGVLKRIAWTWLLTIPSAALIASGLSCLRPLFN